jgi:hypothetical protein
VAKLRRKIVEYEDAPFFDFGACVVVWLTLACCALGLYAAFTL